MKKIFTLLIILLVTGFSATAQEAYRPDYNKIAKDIADKNSGYYYPELRERYIKADTSLTLEQRRHLYYGYAFNKSNGNIDASTAALSKLNEVLIKPNPTDEDYKMVLDYTATVLEYMPFSITIKQYREFCFGKLGRYDEAQTERAQTEMIIDAILSSGDGKTIKNCIHVVDAENEFEVVTIIGYRPQSQEYTTNGEVDYIELSQNLYGTAGLFFEVAQVPKEVTGL
ncbi:DUF4919 domain-containing protein [Flavobacterium sp. RHBU_24]|uniref:DUF4919 domain-containing protein n=1 Tax=Flavobacterium sp. RHBU_24 TaxID=3391185 RepID=UPI003984D8B3